MPELQQGTSSDKALKARRYVKAALGFSLISAAYAVVVIMGLSLLVMSHCVLSDSQIAAGQTCAQPADRFFWPAAIAASLGFVTIQALYLRRALRTETR